MEKAEVPDLHHDIEIIINDGGFPVSRKESHAYGRFVAANHRQTRPRIRHIGIELCGASVLDAFIFRGKRKHSVICITS